MNTRKTEIINAINAIKAEAISLGYDYPTADPTTESVEILEQFYNELSDYIITEKAISTAPFKAR